ncbi:MAG: hypothetical protein HY094_07190 [Candidatus Melainabacteria bacterium]|nr:hypothetical protein [Candidatus Melainabacteria bacterium]
MPITEVNIEKPKVMPSRDQTKGKPYLREQHPDKIASSKWESCKDFASIVCSRESTYRTALDITAFDFPIMGADIFRGIKKFLESSLECLSATVLVGISPYLTSFVGKLASKFILQKDMQKDALHYLRFTMPELRDYKLFKDATKRMKEEEYEDQNFIASLYEKASNKKQAENFKEQAKIIEEFCTQHKPSKKNQEAAYKLKKYTIIFESAIEGGFWGGYGLLLRAFRKYILKEDRFTGTKGYLSDAESSNLGEAGELNLFQKIVGTASIFISPVLNTILLNKLENRESVKKSKFLSVVDKNLDMTHGVYPKLGLLFSQTTIPKWLGTITLSQGWFERVERILKLLTVIPSWWMGHRVTNGLLALSADKKLAKKHNVNPGILVEPEYLKPADKEANFFERLNKRFPEPARIHHVMKSTEENKSLQNEAEDLHARCLYKGFALHSLLVLGINLVVNHITKLRAMHAAGK